MEASKKRAGGSVKSGSPKKQKTAKRGAKAKDTNKPKKPKSAYFFFLDSFRDDLKTKEKNGEKIPTKIGDVAKLAGETWSGMSDEEKKPFYDKNEQAKEEYASKIKEMQGSKDEDKPKKPRTAFFFFLEECREKEKGNMEQKAIPTFAGEKWRAMTDSDKKKYTDLATAAKQKYDEKMNDYRSKNPAPPTPKKTKKAKAKVKDESESEEEEEEAEEDAEEEEEEDDEEEEESD